MRTYRFRIISEKPILAISPSGQCKYWDTELDCACSCDAYLKSADIHRYCVNQVRPSGRFADWKFIEIDNIKIDGDTIIFNNEYVFRKCRPAESQLTVRRITTLRKHLTSEFENVEFRREV